MECFSHEMKGLGKRSFYALREFFFWLSPARKIYLEPSFASKDFMGGQARRHFSLKTCNRDARLVWEGSAIFRWDVNLAWSRARFGKWDASLAWNVQRIVMPDAGLTWKRPGILTHDVSLVWERVGSFGETLDSPKDARFLKWDAPFAKRSSQSPSETPVSPVDASRIF